MYYIYMLRCADNSLYTGITNNLQKRLQEHVYKKVQGAAYTRGRGVVAVAGLWQTGTKSEALKVEYRIKQYRKPQKEALLVSPELLVFEDITVVPQVVKTLEEYL